MTKTNTGKVKFKGGKELNKLLRTAQKGGLKQIEVGFFEGAKYQDGTNVAMVAAIHNFGAPKANIPERPFFTNASRSVRSKILKVLKNNIDPKKMIVPDNLGDKLGLVFSREIQEEIETLRAPPKAASTLRANPGKTNPLVLTGTMKNAVTWESK